MKRPELITSLSRPKFYVNVGCCFDIPTGSPVVGSKGETIINGGIANTTGVVGNGNTFKSTLLHYFMLSAYDKINASKTVETLMQTYDTEVNVSPERLRGLANKFDYINKDNLFNQETGEWIITDKSIYNAEEWMESQREFLLERKKTEKGNLVSSPFLTLEGKPLKLMPFLFTEVDSLSEFETTATVDMATKNELGDKSTNTLFMRQGLMKTKFLMELPKLSHNTNTNFLITAHVGQEINMATGPMAPQPQKKLQHLKGGNKIKGVSDKFFFLMSNLWHVFNVVPLINQSNRTVEYPLKDVLEKETELNVLKVRQLRGKSGPSGYILDTIVSQTEGILGSLTEFHKIKAEGRYGLTGSNIKYHLDIMPEVTLSRPTIRSLLDNDAKLRRAVNITSELLQIEEYWSGHFQELICTPKELYDDLKDLGYDWDELLNTRGWWTYDQYADYLPNFLSTVDLLKMRKGLYTPYWYKKT